MSEFAKYGIMYVNPSEKVRWLHDDSFNRTKTNCVNCGAPLNGYFRCAYCGTRNMDENGKTVLYANGEPIAFF